MLIMGEMSCDSRMKNEDGIEIKYRRCWFEYFLCSIVDILGFDSLFIIFCGGWIVSARSSWRIFS